MTPIDAALAFLSRWCGDETRVLTAVDPDQGYIRTEGFAAWDAAGARTFIRRWDGRRGLYFAVNPDMRLAFDIDKKGKKEHVARVVALHADIDSYKAGETRDEGKTRVLRMLATEVPEGLPGPPSVVVDSGNGMHAYWLLRESIELGGDIAKAEMVERYTRGLAAAVGGDSTTDVSRIMRLPGTINLPNAGKRALGLQSVLTRTVLFDTTRRYDLADFPAVEGKGARYVSSEHEQQAARIQIGDPLPVDSLDQLRVPDRTKALIAVPASVGVRSGRLRSVILSLLGCGESNEVILGVLTDPRWAISESVIEKDDPDAHARRQIIRAHAWLSAQREREFDNE